MAHRYQLIAKDPKEKVLYRGKPLQRGERRCLAGAYQRLGELLRGPWKDTNRMTITIRLERGLLRQPKTWETVHEQLLQLGERLITQKPQRRKKT